MDRAADPVPRHLRTARRHLVLRAPHPLAVVRRRSVDSSARLDAGRLPTRKMGQGGTTRGLHDVGSVLGTRWAPRADPLTPTHPPLNLARSRSQSWEIVPRLTARTACSGGFVGGEALDRGEG